MPALADAHTDANATERLLQRALDDPHLQLLFPHPEERALIDPTGRRVEVPDRTRLQWITRSGHRAAAIVWSTEGKNFSTSSFSAHGWWRAQPRTRCRAACVPLPTRQE